MGSTDIDMDNIADIKDIEDIDIDIGDIKDIDMDISDDDEVV